MRFVLGNSNWYFLSKPFGKIKIKTLTSGRRRESSTTSGPQRSTITANNQLENFNLKVVLHRTVAFIDSRNRFCEVMFLTWNNIYSCYFDVCIEVWTPSSYSVLFRRKLVILRATPPVGVKENNRSSCSVFETWPFFVQVIKQDWIELMKASRL